MRIGLVSYEYPPQRGLGGVGSYTFRLAGALGRMGHEVVVLAGPSEGAEMQQSNVTVHRLAARYDPQRGGRALRWLYWRLAAPLLTRANPLVWHWLRWDLASLAALEELDRASPLDVIEAPEHAANGLMIGRARAWPLVLRTHGPWDLFYRLNRNPGFVLNRVLAELERGSASFADVTTSPSRTMARLIHRRWALETAPLVVPNFMDVPQRPADLPGESETQRIVCTGRIEGFKGQHILVEAFARIAGAHPRAKLVLIGPDQWSHQQRFSTVVDGLAGGTEVRRRIELTGPQSLAATQRLLGEASIAVIPSLGFESFSFSTLEAMAAGRPIIGARSGAVPELLDYGRCGKLVAAGDVAALAGAIDLLLKDAGLRRKLARAAHERARLHYGTEVVLPQIIAVYHEARERFRAKQRSAGGVGLRGGGGAQIGICSATTP